MAEAFLEIRDARGTRREPLRAGRTRLGGPGADVPLHGAEGDELHVWDAPPRAVHVGTGARPTRGGEPFEEAELSSGERIEWRGAEIVYRAPAEDAAEASAVLEELPAEPGPDLGPGAERVLRRLHAGMLVELGLADRAAARRWQEAVVGGAFDPDRCAEEIAARSGVAPGDPRLLERSARLLRDLLMAPLQRGARGAGRRARAAARSGLAFVVAQAFALVAYSVLLAVLLLLLRYRDVSIDAWLDRVLLR